MVHYPKASKVILVMDNLNTHSPASLYETFPPAQAKQLLDRLEIGRVPEETARLAKAVFPEGSTFMKMRDELGTLYQDEQFAALFPKNGQPALAPWRLALVTIMQFARSDYLIDRPLMPLGHLLR